MGICLARVYDSATTVCARAFITYIRVTVPAPMFWLPVYLILVFFTDISFHKSDTSLSPLPHPMSFKIHELDCTPVEDTL